MTAKIIQHQFRSEARAQNAEERINEKTEPKSAADIHHSTIERLFAKMDIELLSGNALRNDEKPTEIAIDELPMTFSRSRAQTTFSARRARRTVSRLRECINSVQGLRIAIP